MPRQHHDAQYLVRLQDYHRQHRALPTMTAMTELLGLSSTATVFEMIGRLKSAGYLAQGPDRRLVPGRRFFARPLLGVIRTVLLRVKGRSMCEAGILDADKAAA